MTLRKLSHMTILRMMTRSVIDANMEKLMPSQA